MEVLENGPFILEALTSTPENFLPKPSKQWYAEERGLANQGSRLKSIIIYALPKDTMKFVIRCKTAKEMWTGLVLGHERPSETRDTKITVLMLKFNAFKALSGEKVA